MSASGSASTISAPARTVSARTDRRRSLTGTGIGNALEWFDWSIYSTFAPFFAASFFDPSDTVSAFLAALVVFAAGFIARPIGGYLFGRLGDRLGRKTTMALTVILISIAGLIIAICPPYAQIGVAASVILVIARLLQGLAYGGEQPAAGSYLSEQAPAERRGLWSSLIYATGTFGAVMGLVLGAVLSALLTREDMFAWGWRIPFIIAALGGLYALWMRRNMSETQAFTESISVVEAETAEKPALVERPNIWRDMWTMRRSVIQVIGLVVGATVAYYYWVVATSAYSISVLGADPTAVLIAGVAANLLFIAMLPAWGAISDRIGRRPVMLFGLVGLMATIIPMTSLIDGNPVNLFIAMLVASVFLTALTSISPAVMAELFPTRMRTTGVAVPLAVATAIFGGTAPYLQTWMATNFGATSFAIYVIVLLAISAITVLTLPETRGRILTDETHEFTGKAPKRSAAADKVSA